MRSFKCHCPQYMRLAIGSFVSFVVKKKEVEDKYAY